MLHHPPHAQGDQIPGHAGTLDIHTHQVAVLDGRGRIQSPVAGLAEGLAGFGSGPGSGEEHGHGPLDHFIKIWEKVAQVGQGQLQFGGAVVAAGGEKGIEQVQAMFRQPGIEQGGREDTHHPAAARGYGHRRVDKEGCAGSAEEGGALGPFEGVQSRKVIRR